jgi:hypothetical protein
VRIEKRNDSVEELPFRVFPLIPIPPLAVARSLIVSEPVTTREAVNEKHPSTIPFGWLNDVPDDPAVSKGQRL